MGQKVHPHGFRLGVTKDHQSQWFSSSEDYSVFLKQDHFLRTFLVKKYGPAAIAGMTIERKVHQIWITIETANPRLLLGKGQEDLETLQKDLEKRLQKYTLRTLVEHKKASSLRQAFSEKPLQIAIFVTKIAQPEENAAVISQFLVDELEQRVPFRRAIRQAVQRAQRQNVGIKIQISGRLNGAEMARTEWVREGRVPLQTLRANVDYCYTTAKTIYGLLGIKVWISKPSTK